MGFADEVAACSTGSVTSVGYMVQALNCLTKQQRSDVLSFIDKMPDGIQKKGLALAIYRRAQKRGYEGPELTSGHLRTFLAGDRYGLEA